MNRKSNIYKKIFIIGMLILLCICSCACAAEKHSETTPGAKIKSPVNSAVNKKILRKQSDADAKYLDNYVDYITEDNIKGPDAQIAEIPVFYEKDLLFDNDGSFALGFDSGYYALHSARFDEFSTIQKMFPSKAMRESAAKDYFYILYDTDKDSRVYLFFSNKTAFHFLEGFPVVMKKKLGFNDFSNLKAGDNMQLAENIDPAAALYRQFFDSRTDTGIANWAKKGEPLTSIHLLADGILKITYERTNGQYTITDIVYSKDYILNGLDGASCYKISDADYIQ